MPAFLGFTLIAFVAVQPTLQSQSIKHKFAYIKDRITIINDCPDVGKTVDAQEAAWRVVHSCSPELYDYNDVVNASFGWSPIEKTLLHHRWDYLKTKWESVLDELDRLNAASNQSSGTQYFESQWFMIKKIFDEMILISDKLTSTNSTWFVYFDRASIILAMRNIPVRKEIRDEIIDYCVEAMKYFAQACGDQTVYTEYALESLKEIDEKLPGLLAMCERILKKNPGYYECGSIKYFSNLMDRYYVQKVEGRWRSQPIASGSCSPQ